MRSAIIYCFCASLADRTSPPGNLDRFTALSTLILDKNSLTTLRGFPRLPSVTTLWLNNNAFADLVEILQAIRELFPSVTYLSLMRNPCAPALAVTCEADIESAQRYRLYCIHRLPALTFLDASPVTPAERADAAARGAFCAPKRPGEGSVASGGSSGGGAGGDSFFGLGALFGWSNAAAAPAAAATTTTAARQTLPLPEKKAPTAFLAIGTTKYDGRNSEGNRFIRDSDL
jgi:hypothetical protein